MQYENRLSRHTFKEGDRIVVNKTYPVYLIRIHSLNDILGSRSTIYGFRVKKLKNQTKDGK